MEWWNEARLAFQGLMDQHGLLAGFVLVLVEEAGVPVPIPGDVLMLALGVHARQGLAPLWQALVVLELATVFGASVLYLASARAGRGLVYQYGRYIHLTPERLDRAENWLRSHGSRAIIFGRLTPGLRMATVIGCGVFGVPFWRFLPALALGGLLYILLYTLLGFFVGPVVLQVLEGIHVPLGLLGSLLPLVLLSVWIARARRGLRLREANDASVADRPHRWRDGAVAGVLATVLSTLVMNVLVVVAGDLALLAPGDLVDRARARLAVLALIRVIGPVLLLAWGISVHLRRGAKRCGTRRSASRWASSTRCDWLVSRPGGAARRPASNHTRSGRPDTRAGDILEATVQGARICPAQERSPSASASSG